MVKNLKICLLIPIMILEGCKTSQNKNIPIEPEAPKIKSQIMHESDTSTIKKLYLIGFEKSSESELTLTEEKYDEKNKKIITVALATLGAITGVAIIGGVTWKVIKQSNINKNIEKSNNLSSTGSYKKGALVFNPKNVQATQDNRVQSTMSTKTLTVGSDAEIIPLNNVNDLTELVDGTGSYALISKDKAGVLTSKGDVIQVRDVQLEVEGISEAALLTKVSQKTKLQEMTPKFSKIQDLPNDSSAANKPNEHGKIKIMLDQSNRPVTHNIDLGKFQDRAGGTFDNWKQVQVIFVEGKDNTQYLAFDPRLDARKMKLTLMNKLKQTFIQDLNGKDVSFKHTGKMIELDGKKYELIELN